MKLIICAPIQSFDHSNGLLALVHMGVDMSKLGADVYFCMTGVGEQSEFAVNSNELDRYENDVNAYEHQLLNKVNYLKKMYGIKMLDQFDPASLKDYIALYPETITNNPLNVERVIRFFGNKNGVLVKPVVVGNADFIISHSRTLYTGADHYLYFPHIDPAFFPDHVNDYYSRKFNSYYVGKGILYTNPHHFDDAIEITRHWPNTKKAVSILLQNSQFFLTYDSWSNINLEAILCGAVPVYLNNGPFTDEEIDGSELGEIPRVKFNDEIVISKDFISNFVEKRENLLKRVVNLNQQWLPSLGEMLRKIERHFS